MATETTLNSAKAWSPDVSTFAPTEVVPEALILTTSTVAGAIEGDEPSLRVAFVDDADAQFTAEGNTIPEADPDLDEVLVHTGKITQLVRLSAEQYRQASTAQQISESVRRAIVRKANQAYLAQPVPTSPAVTPPPGLLNIAGILSGDAVTGDLDSLVDIVAELEGNDGTPTGIILDPTGWATLRKIKTATGAATSLLGAGTTDSDRRLLDLPVMVSNAMPAGTGLIVDRSAIVSAVGPLRVATSDQAYFTSDSVAVRATWRIGWNVVRPERIAKFTIGD